MSLFAPRHHRIKQRQLVPGSYLTDGEHLLRVLSLFVTGRSMLVSIEDCLTLETRAYAASELEAKRLRLVRGKPTHAAIPPTAALDREQQAVLH